MSPDIENLYEVTETKATSTCPGCQLALPKTGGPRHAYLGASPECWALFGELLAREYSDPSYFAVHGLTVDAYAAQHPGREERRTIQSIHVHLAALCLALEHDVALNDLIAVRKRIADYFADRLVWLSPPGDPGGLNVTDVLQADSAEVHSALVRAWATSVWNAWTAHHDAVRKIAKAALD